jgi:RNA polymerase sigma-70 factor (ECF subfamily)
MNSTLMSRRTDQALVIAARGGDDLAATELYNRYARRVFALVHSQMSDWLRSVTEPEDIVQSVFKSMFRGLQGGQFEAPPGNTLWSLIAVIAVRKTRRRATHHSAQRRDAHRVAPLREGDATSASEQLTLKVLEMDLGQTLATLRESDRKVLLARIQGHSVEEIAQIMGRTGRTIERSLQRIREQLADLLLNEME